MTNREKYANRIIDIACSGSGIALVDGKLCRCEDIEECSRCGFTSGNHSSCQYIALEWSNSEYVEPPVDWSKVAVDTPILVKDHERAPWCRRYFAKYEDGKVLTWKNGRTSWNAHGYIDRWQYGKLADGENE